MIKDDGMIAKIPQNNESRQQLIEIFKIKDDKILWDDFINNINKI